MDSIAISPELLEKMHKICDWIIKTIKEIVSAIKKMLREFIEQIMKSGSPRQYYIYINTKSYRIKKKAQKRAISEMFRLLAHADYYGPRK